MINELRLDVTAKLVFVSRAMRSICPSATGMFLLKIVTFD